jgi:hypothetical protein
MLVNLAPARNDVCVFAEFCHDALPLVIRSLYGGWNESADHIITEWAATDVLLSPVIHRLNLGRREGAVVDADVVEKAIPCPVISTFCGYIKRPWRIERGAAL